MLNASLVNNLKQIVSPQNILTSKEDILSYSYDASTVWRHNPDAIVFPHTTEQVSRIVKLANENKIPVTTRGGGTNVSGGSIPIKGGIVLCTTRMNRIINIKKETLTAEVECGVLMQEFNQALAKEGLMYPPDPQSAQGATMGGTVAENAGGPLCVKYGITKQYVLGLEVVLANGDIVKLGAQTVKNRMGYELASLFVGSEGMLGIITKIILRLVPLPKAQKTMLAVFNDPETAGASVSAIIAAGILPAKIEFMDRWYMNRVEELNHLGLPTAGEAMLLIQVDGAPEALESETVQIIKICREMKAIEASVAKDDAEANRYWLARKSAFGAAYSAAPTMLSEDVTIPRDKISALIKELKRIGDEHGFQIHISGHAGDGNLHPSILTDINDKANFEKAVKAVEEMVAVTLKMGGVISGEHGIGLEKKQFMKAGMDPIALKMMKDIKNLLDPNNILNPDKFWED